jgi:asparagine synthase (glutamine-hydrolysing)
MCGVAGLINLGASTGSAEAEEKTVRRMLDVQGYRGPDDSGIQRVGNAVLGSLRLAIIDLSPAGHMPMSEASGRYWIYYNGEVFNIADIRAELSELWHNFTSKSYT